MYGPDHRVIKPASPKFSEDCFNDDDYDDEDDLLGEQKEMDVEETHVSTNAEVNEARKDMILGAITTTTWQRAKVRLNRHEKILLQAAEGELTSHAQIKERFWEWLKRGRDECLTRNSVPAATLDEALDQWGAATYLELDVLELNNSTIENEHARNVQLAIDNLPAPSKLCARKPLASLVSEEGRQALAALGSLGDLELPMDGSLPQSQIPMETQPSSASATVMQATDPDVEMTVATATEAEPTHFVSEEMEVTVPTPVNGSIASAPEQVPQTSAVDATVGEASGTVVPTAPQRPARISPKKSQQAAIVAAKPPPAKITAEEIDCPIVKWPASLLMQNVENLS